MRYLLVALIIGMAALLPTVSRAAPSAITVSLVLADMPHGFAQKEDLTLNNAQAASAHHVPVSVLEQQGRVLQHDVVFARAGANGILFVEEVVVSYRSDSAAHGAFGTLTRQTAPGFSALPIGSLGAEHTGLTRQLMNGSLNETVDAFFFHRGLFTVIMVVGGATATFSVAQAQIYPQIVDTRIQHAH